MVKANEDCKVGVFCPMFYLDGKRFTGPEGHAYLRDECGFSNAEAVAYLCLLSSLQETS